MKITVGLILLLSAGCVSMPTGSSSRDHPPLPMPPNDAARVRIGVEYLPPDHARDYTQAQTDGTRLGLAEADSAWSRPLQTSDEVVVSHRPLRDPDPPPELPLDFTGRQERWELSRETIRATQNTLERVALRFLSELIGDDHKRVERAIGAPLLRSQLRLSSDPLSNYLDERDREDHHRRMTRNGTRMVRRPLRNALKELPLFNDVEVAIHSFKAKNVTSTPRNRRKYGRVSLRLRAGRFEDPVEVAWIRQGFRVGSSMEYLKASYSTELLPNLHIHLRSRYNYDDARPRLLGSLEYDISPSTRLHALAGNRINLFSGLRTYPGGPQGETSTKGLLVLVEHQF